MTFKLNKGPFMPTNPLLILQTRARSGGVNDVCHFARDQEPPAGGVGRARLQFVPPPKR